MLGLKQEMGDTGGCFYREYILVGRPKVSNIQIIKREQSSKN